MTYPLPLAADVSSSFAVLFNFSSPPIVAAHLDNIVNKVAVRHSRCLKGNSATAAYEPPTNSQQNPPVKSTLKTASTSRVVLPAVMPDITELVDCAECVLM